MADNVTVTNQQTSFEANSNSDIAVRTSELASGKHVGHVRLDKGSGSAESVVTDANPLPITGSVVASGTVTANIGTLNGAATESTLSSLLLELQQKTEPADTQAITGDVNAIQSGVWSVRTTDGDGNKIATATTTPGASDRGLVVRNIPSGTQAVSGTVAVSTVTTVTNITNQGQLVDNAPFTDGTTRLNVAGFIFDEVAGTALTENDGAAARIDSKRAQIAVIEDVTNRRRAGVTVAGELQVSDAQLTTVIENDTLGGKGNILKTGMYDDINGAWRCLTSDDQARVRVIASQDATYLVTLDAGTNVIGKTGHDINGIADGRKTVTTAGTRETLVGSSTPCKKVDIVALETNTGTVVIGGNTCVASSGTRQGVPLVAGQPYSFEIDNLQDVYIDATVSGEGVSFTYFT